MTYAWGPRVLVGGGPRAHFLPVCVGVLGVPCSYGSLRTAATAQEFFPGQLITTRKG